jgi:hypothetical protein
MRAHPMRSEFPAHCDQIIARNGTLPRSRDTAHHDGAERSRDLARSATVKTHPPGLLTRRSIILARFSVEGFF